LGEDYENYPRTMEADTAALEEAGVDALFAPLVGEVYPNGFEESTHVEVPVLSDILCGAVRRGHFRGVATVVCKLFNMVLPDLAVFGEKDWQQLMVIRHMVSDLAMPVQIYGAQTIRETDGLAKSSRNQYLSAGERATAARLHATMDAAATRIRRGDRNFAAIESEALEDLAEAGFKPDYFAVRRAMDLMPPEEPDAFEDLRVLAAAWLGKARLIDNIPVS
jgi:pantoate--beta-alanine ligase